MSTRTTNLDVRGMSCATCASTIEDAVADLEEVTSIDVNFATDEATLEYDPDEVGLDEIYDAIEDAGYEPDRTKPSAFSNRVASSDFSNTSPMTGGGDDYQACSHRFGKRSPAAVSGLAGRHHNSLRQRNSTASNSNG